MSAQPLSGRGLAGGHAEGDIDTIISVDQVAAEAQALRTEVPEERLVELAGGNPFLSIRGLVAGYGNMQILHGFTLHVARGQSLCLIGPNGAGKSTVLHSIFGFTRIFGGQVLIGEGQRRDITRLSSDRKLADARVAYILQDKSVFPQMTVEENLLMGGFLLDSRARARQAAERVFDKYPRLAARRGHAASVRSGGERRLLEISRALVMEPEVLLVDEPSIGLEPRFIDMVFEILHDLQRVEGKTIVMVEQNAKKGLQFADLGYVLVSGELALAGPGDELLANPDVGRLFLGG
jgi:branched-chain amino acid transport system ATP-binding protein